VSPNYNATGHALQGLVSCHALHRNARFSASCKATIVNLPLDSWGLSDKCGGAVALACIDRSTGHLGRKSLPGQLEPRVCAVCAVCAMRTITARPQEMQFREGYLCLAFQGPGV
jgi:hypothetical protein